MYLEGVSAGDGREELIFGAIHARGHHAVVKVLLVALADWSRVPVGRWAGASFAAQAWHAVTFVALLADKDEALERSPISRARGKVHWQLETLRAEHPPDARAGKI